MPIKIFKSTIQKGEFKNILLCGDKEDFHRWKEIIINGNEEFDRDVQIDIIKIWLQQS